MFLALQAVAIEVAVEVAAAVTVVNVAAFVVACIYWLLVN